MAFDVLCDHVVQEQHARARQTLEQDYWASSIEGTQTLFSVDFVTAIRESHVLLLQLAGADEPSADGISRIRQQDCQQGGYIGDRPAM